MITNEIYQWPYFFKIAWLILRFFVFDLKKSSKKLSQTTNRAASNVIIKKAKPCGKYKIIVQ